MTNIKLDRRKLRPRAITAPAKPKKGMNAWKRHNVFKTYLNEYKDDIEALIKAGSTVTQIAEQLAEAGLPTITNKTLSKHLKEILPKAYSEYLSRNRKQQQLNNFTCPLTNLNASQIDIATSQATTIKAEEVAIKMPTPAPPPPTQTKETKEEQKPVINIENLNTLEDVERLFFDYSVKVEPNLLSNSSNNPKKHLQSFIDDMNFSGGFIMTEGSWLKYFNEEHSPYMTALLEQAYSKGFISEEKWEVRRNRKGARQGIKAFLDKMNTI